MTVKSSRRKRTGRTGAKHPLDCSRIEPMLFDYFSRELGDRQSMLVREHVRQCRACSEAAASIQNMVAWMKENDPGRNAPTALTGRRRRWLLWLMEHPFVARCLLHSRMTALVVACVFVLLVLLVLLTLRPHDWIRRDLPRYPVRLEVVDPTAMPGTSRRDSDPPPLDPPPARSEYW